MPEAGLLAGLLGTDRPTYLGGLVAVPDRAAREVPLARACGAWVDSYTGGDQP